MRLAHLDTILQFGVMQSQLNMKSYFYFLVIVECTKVG
jgi:hypothetical protein